MSIIRKLLTGLILATLFAIPAAQAAGPIWVDRVQDTSVTVGLTDFVLTGTPPTGLQAWSTVGNGNTAYYLATDTTGDWEIGLGTYASVGPTLARTTVTASSASGAKVSFPAGTQTISLIAPASWIAGQTVGSSTVISGANTKVLFDNSGVLGEYTISGSGSVCMTTSCVMVTPQLGTPASGNAVNLTGYTVANIVGDTSTALGVGSIELGNASDTTMARSAPGVASVEGLPLYSGIPQNSKSAAYTLVLADAQEHIYHPTTDNNARIWTINSNANVAYPIGTVLTFINDINTITISITTDTMVLCGTGATGSRTLAVNGMATAVKVTSTRWYICGQGLT